ncbi:MAG: hypothetical protein H0V55_05550 [Thermoleophilaceae bacterium]|jgi:hypothetical protein|nr:hypothetical protein [Thermoleophilaceae bacterium]MBA3840577.1 hypothetical protein [Thermoleophilaceae bacterium]
MDTEPSTLRDWLREHPPHDSAFRQTIAGVASRHHAGEDFMPAVRELLDEFALLMTDSQRARALRDEPQPTGDPRFDAYLGALAEHLAITSSLPRPEWTLQPARFLDRFWFVSDVPGFRATAIAQSPAAFRRRGIFIARGPLERC